jgi:hypothetical protein
MKLDALVRGKLQEPITVLLYGVEGIGKSTFGADAPKPIFIDAEGGTAHLDVPRFPRPESWQDVLDALGELESSKHEFQTVVVDTLDWIEPLIWKHICERDSTENKRLTSVEDYGYGKGYEVALDEWRQFVAALERLKRKGMNVILLGHCWVKPFKNPEGEDYDRYQMKLHAKAAGFLREWPRNVLFAKHDTIAAKDQKTNRVRGVSTKKRLVYTEQGAAFDAKNRSNLPPSFPLGWEQFAALVLAADAALPDLRAEVERKAILLGGAECEKALIYLKANENNATKLAQLNNRLNVKIEEKETANV